MKRTVAMAFVLAVVWLLWSGHYTPLILSLGAVSLALVVAVGRKMRILDDEGAPLRLPLGLPLYLPWLAFETAKASVDVALRVLKPSLPISPRMVRVRAGQRTDLGRVIYANSITLTPGTVTVDTEGDTIAVHALTAESADELLAGKMDRRVTRNLEGRR